MYRHLTGIPEKYLQSFFIFTALFPAFQISGVVQTSFKGPSMYNAMKKREQSPILLIILLLALLGAGFIGIRQTLAVKNMRAEKERAENELDGVNRLKEELAWEVDSLQKAYLDLSAENQSLKESFAAAENKWAKRIVQASNQAKNNANAQINGLRAEIQALMASKAELENVIGQLQAENDSLRVRTGDLERDLSIAQDEKAALAKLNETIQDELLRMTVPSFQATAFQVEVEQRRPVATAKSMRARRILVTFDLANVPDKYRGLRPLYLVITNEQGIPISTRGIPVKSVVNGQVVELIAARARDVNITASQRLSFTHDLEDRLRPGFYRVSVFTDIGLLGAASFRLQ
jgi:peptidoglycan hydrolase CwlO-like protein